MPYIKKEVRENIDWIIDNLASELITKGVAGNMNYALFKLYCKLEQLGEVSNYKEKSRFLAELHECAEEIRRRKLAPYEDEKIEQNGDVE